MSKKDGPSRAKPAASKAKGSAKPARPAAKPKAAAKPAPKAKAPAAKKPAAKPVKAPAKAETKAPKAGTTKAPPKAEPAKPAKVEAPKTAPKAAPAPAAAPARKGITIVSPKRPRAPKPKPSTTYVSSAGGLGTSVIPRKPLIPSGPHAASRAVLDQADPNAKRKSPFSKSQLDRFRKILQTKRAELAGEVTGLENEALRASSGSLSHTPSHMAEQGTETADQSLSLDLAAQERKLIREIDEAIKRIDEGVFGLCELTGKPIPADRLEELPWTRYSIDAARELERRSYQR